MITKWFLNSIAFGRIDDVEWHDDGEYWVEVTLGGAKWYPK
ncbi:hypothetical protein LCGC14_1030360 [marine sediment metagenome]|uniref:Uncharacterized protein n=1 Tax=marine sediment metagenome TaxID=412755 RepID=A0A0F9NGI5_9ZZZZ